MCFLMPAENDRELFPTDTMAKVGSPMGLCLLRGLGETAGTPGLRAKRGTLKEKSREKPPQRCLSLV